MLTFNSFSQQNKSHKLLGYITDEKDFFLRKIDEKIYICLLKLFMTKLND